MQLSANEEMLIRVWVGDSLPTTYLEDLYDSLSPNSSWDSVVVHALQREIALASEQPASFSVPGLSLSWGQQVMYLQDTLKRFMDSGGMGLDPEGTAPLGGVLVGRLVRYNPR